MYIPGSDRDTVLRQVREGANLGTAMLSMAAQRDGATVEHLNSRLAVAHSGDRSVILDGCFCTETSVGTQIIKDKLLAKEYLRAHKVRTPRGEVARAPDEAIAIARSLGGKVVIKPRRGLKGAGVSVDLSSDEEVRAAFEHARTHEPDVLVEEHIDIQQELRCLTSDVHCDAVVRRTLPWVTGDGFSSIRALILHANAARDENPALFGRHTPLDSTTVSYLARRGLTLDDVLEEARTLTVRNVGGISSGGVPEQVRDEVGNDVLQLATDAVAAIPGLTWAGVDVVVDKHSGEPYVIELNADAGFGAATYPLKGEPRDVAATMWALMADRAKPVRASHGTQPDLLSEPSNLDSAVPYLSDQPRTLGDLLADHAQARGYEALDVGSRMVQVSTRDGTRVFTQFGSSDRDLVTAGRAVRNFGWQRRFLARAQVPRPRGRRVPGPAALRNFLEGARRSVTLIPADKPWTSRFKVIGESDDPNLAENLAGGTAWIVQNRPRGPRLRLLASVDQVFFATLTEGSVLPTAEQFEDAIAATLCGVAAIPGLRWAAVDLCIQVGQGQGRARVEGMTLSPAFGSTDRLIAGQPLNFLEWLIRATE